MLTDASAMHQEAIRETTPRDGRRAGVLIRAENDIIALFGQVGISTESLDLGQTRGSTASYCRLSVQPHAAM